MNRAAQMKQMIQNLMTRWNHKINNKIKKKII